MPGGEKIVLDSRLRGSDDCASRVRYSVGEEGYPSFIWQILKSPSISVATKVLVGVWG